jgi:two-component system sensor histidine kinase/response regulator
MVDYSNSGGDFDIPAAIKEKWQRIVNIMSDLLHVPTGFIMKANSPHIEIFTTNVADTNPYHAGQTFELDGLYCEEVMQSDNLLLVPDALKDPEWDNNPEIPAGFIYYLGYPIHWPTGKMFGTICVQDYKNNIYATGNEELLQEFRSVCELDLVMVQQRHEKERLMAELEQEIAIRKIAEKESDRSLKAAESASRAKGIFLAKMSHELRTPLNAILGFGQLMARDTDFPEKHRENLDILSDSGEHLLNLINDVLEISRIESRRTSLDENVFKLDRMLETIERMTRLQVATKGLKLNVALSPGVPQAIKADEAKIRHVLINLLDNAVKYTESGAITLRVDCQTSTGSVDTGSEVSGSLHSQFEEQRTVHFEVEDTGIGISPENQKIVFDQFAQATDTEEHREGVGLGLAICDQYVRLMGGRISVKSQPGKGSTFSLELPCEFVDESEALSGEPTHQVIGLEPGQPLYDVLIVDDDANSRIVLRELIEQVGFRVREAKDGRQAVEMHKKLQPDLIWMDIRMPVMDGLGATRRIREQELKWGDSPRHVSIIALTASVFEEDRDKVVAAGCDDFVRKPFLEGEVFGKMAQHLGVRYVYDERAPHAADSRGLKVSATDLMVLPPDWIARFRQAAKRGRSDDLLELLKEVQGEHSAVADALARMVRDYQFAKIVALLDEGDTHE